MCFFKLIYLPTATFLNLRISHKKLFSSDIFFNDLTKKMLSWLDGLLKYFYNGVLGNSLLNFVVK